MTDSIATATSCSNIAFIKYWGNRDDQLRLPANGSISMNLAGLETTTTVMFSDHLERDQLALNGVEQSGEPLARITRHLGHIRAHSGSTLSARVVSRNTFPTGAGIASSASGFAALTVAACQALGLDLAEAELSALARLGSGSACRSIPGGYVEWFAGNNHETSFARSIAAAEYWGLIDLVAVVSREHKVIGSTGGHQRASSSALQAARVADSDRRLAICRDAIAQRDFEALAAIVEEDALMMHSVMMTSHPALIYWQPPTLRIMHCVQAWREEGIPVAFTIDAGPNVHVLSLIQHQSELRERLLELPEVIDVLTASPGGAARVIDRHLIG